MKYTQEQMKIARLYEARAMAAVHDDNSFNEIMKEFEALKKSWNDNNNYLTGDVIG